MSNLKRKQFENEHIWKHKYKQEDSETIIIIKNKLWQMTSLKRNTPEQMINLKRTNLKKNKSDKENVEKGQLPKRTIPKRNNWKKTIPKRKNEKGQSRTLFFCSAIGCHTFTNGSVHSAGIIIQWIVIRLASLQLYSNKTGKN